MMAAADEAEGDALGEAPPVAAATARPSAMPTVEGVVLMQPGGGDGGGFVPPGGAREMVVLQASLPVAVPAFGAVEPAAATPLLDGGRQDYQKLRRRVIAVSAVLAAYAVFSVALDYFVDIETMHDVMAKMNEVQLMKGEAPSLAAFVAGCLPNLGFALALSLAVPFCGWYGARNHQSCLVGTFSCCSLCDCCSTCLAALMLFIAAAGIQATLPKAEHWLVECDPFVCMPQGNLTQPSHVVDCLATGIWGSSYSRNYSGDPSYPTHCVKGWLECAGDGVQPQRPKRMVEGLVPQVASDRRRLRPIFGAEEATVPELPPPEEEAAAPAAPAAGFPARALSVVPWQRKGGRDHERKHGLWGGSSRRGEEGRPLSKLKSKPPAQPKNVLASCKASAEDMAKFHAVAGLVPEIGPRVCLVLLAKAAICLPAIVLHCLGFCWGKDLCSQASRSGRQPWHATAAHPPQIMLQPALGSVAAASSRQPADATMVEPLILSPPTVTAT